jgi:hypothetical protein
VCITTKFPFLGFIGPPDSRGTGPVVAPHLSGLLDLSGLRPDSRALSARAQRGPPDLSGLGPVSRGFTSDSREVHRTCPVESLLMVLFVLGAINRPSHTPLELLATQQT